MTIKRVTKHVYQTSDGKPFDTKEAAQAHQARLDLGRFFHDQASDAGEVHTSDVAEYILDNLDAFADVIRPLIRKPRGKAEAQADDYEAALAEAKPKGKAA